MTPPEHPPDRVFPARSRRARWAACAGRAPAGAGGRLGSLVLLLSLVACQPAYIEGEPNLDSPYYRPPTGSTLEIREPVVVDAGRDRVYFQRGRRRAWHEVNEYRAYCALMLAERADQARTIEPGSYRVEAVSRRHLFQLARAPARALPVDRRDRGRDDYRVLALVLRLSGPDRRLEGLACAQWELPQGMARVTVRGIRASLGTAFALHLASR